MAIPAPVVIPHKWRFVPAFQLFIGDTALPVHHGFLLYELPGFEFQAAFQIEKFVVVCERKLGRDWFLCLFQGNKHATISVVPPDRTPYETVFGFIKYRLNETGAAVDTLNLRPLEQNSILKELKTAFDAGLNG